MQRWIEMQPTVSWSALKNAWVTSAISVVAVWVLVCSVMVMIVALSVFVRPVL